MDHQKELFRAPSGRQDPHGLREGLHHGRGDAVRRLQGARKRGGGEGGRKVPPEGKDLRGARRRHHQLQVQHSQRSQKEMKISMV